jgi:hypothetical protein
MPKTKTMTDDQPIPPIPPTPPDHPESSDPAEQPDHAAAEDHPEPRDHIEPPVSAESQDQIERSVPALPRDHVEPSGPSGPLPLTRWAAIRSDVKKATGHSPDLTPDQQITRRTFVSFAAFTLLGVAAWKSWFWIKDGAQSDGVQGALRTGLNIDDRIFKHTLSRNHLAKTYPISEAAKNVRYNSGIGLSTAGFDAAAWRLQVTTVDNRILSISIDDLKRIPKTEFAFEFKCIEGWSQISWWGGCRFSDFVHQYGLTAETALEYVGLSTPDDQYYAGIDMASAMHPQTLLCYEMNGQPLPTRHGAPLRLIIPIKYGVKNLKRIGKMQFSNDRPRDYWFERGYDYYCGL